MEADKPNAKYDSNKEGVTEQICVQNVSRTLQPRINLTLDNFDKDEEIPPDCPFVLTSPRSLEACKRLGVRVSALYAGAAMRLGSLTSPRQHDKKNIVWQY